MRTKRTLADALVRRVERLKPNHGRRFNEVCTDLALAWLTDTVTKREFVRVRRSLRKHLRIRSYLLQVEHASALEADRHLRELFKGKANA